MSHLFGTTMLIAKIVGKLFLCVGMLCAGCIPVYSQNPHFFTKEGKPLPSEAYRRAAASSSNKTESTLAPNEITALAGYFRVTFSNQTSEPAGGYYHPLLGEQRRNVVLAVLKDVSSLIARPKTPADTVEILALCAFRRDATAASATAVYGDMTAAQTGILDGGVWTTLNSGTDAFRFLPDRPAYHGIVEINVAQTFNYDYNASHFNDIDLYTVLLHECLHLLGIATFIQPDGTSLTNNKAIGYYTRFDTYLRAADGTSLVSRNDDCFSARYGYVPATILQKPCSGAGAPVVFSGTGETVPIYTPYPFAPGTSLCHVDPFCGAHYQTVMIPSIEHGKAQRAPSAADVRMLTDIGYVVTGSYGVASNDGGRYGQYPAAGIYTAAANDSLVIEPEKPETMMFNGADILQNDVGVVSVGCLDVIGGKQVGTVVPASDSLRVLYGKEYVFIAGPEFSGHALVRYIGKGATSSNIGYIMFSTKTMPGLPCAPSASPFLCNGGFEETQGGGGFEKWGLGSSPENCSLLSPLTGWRNMPYTPDIYTRRSSGRLNRDDHMFFPYDAVKLINVLPFSEMPDSWDGDENNQVVIGVLNSRESRISFDDTTDLLNLNEGVIQYLPIQNADRSREYVLDLHAYGIPYLGKKTSCRISATITAEPVCTRFRDYGTTDTPYDFGGQVVVDSTFAVRKWHKLRGVPFRLPDGESCYVIVNANKFPEPKVSRNYILIDDIRLRPAGFGLDVTSEVQFPCPGEVIPFNVTVWWDDSAYVRPLTLQAFLPESMELVEGDFQSKAGIVIANVPNVRMDSIGRVTMTLLARIKDDPRVFNSFQTVRVIPKDAPRPEVYGKTSATITVAPPGLQVGKTITKTSENDSLTFFNIRTTVCNTLTVPVTIIKIADSLPAPLRLLDSTIRQNGTLLINDLGFNTKYTRSGDKFTFRSFDLPPYWPSSADSLGACMIFEYMIATPKGTDVLDIPSEITASKGACHIATSAGSAGKKLSGSKAQYPHIEMVYPNPCGAMATVVIDIPQMQHARLEVVDLLGRMMQTFVSGIVQPGRYEFSIETAEWRNGTYMIILRTEDIPQTVLLSVMK